MKRFAFAVLTLLFAVVIVVDGGISGGGQFLQ